MVPILLDVSREDDGRKENPFLQWNSNSSTERRGTRLVRLDIIFSLRRSRSYYEIPYTRASTLVAVSSTAGKLSVAWNPQPTTSFLICLIDTRSIDSDSMQIAVSSDEFEII